MIEISPVLKLKVILHATKRGKQGNGEDIATLVKQIGRVRLSRVIDLIET